MPVLTRTLLRSNFFAGLGSATAGAAPWATASSANRLANGRNPFQLQPTEPQSAALHAVGQPVANETLNGAGTNFANTTGEEEHVQTADEGSNAPVPLPVTEGQAGTERPAGMLKGELLGRALLPAGQNASEFSAEKDLAVAMDSIQSKLTQALHAQQQSSFDISIGICLDCLGFIDGIVDRVNEMASLPGADTLSSQLSDTLSQLLLSQNRVMTVLNSAMQSMGLDILENPFYRLDRSSRSDSLMAMVSPIPDRQNTTRRPSPQAAGVSGNVRRQSPKTPLPSEAGFSGGPAPLLAAAPPGGDFLVESEEINLLPSAMPVEDMAPELPGGTSAAIALKVSEPEKNNEPLIERLDMPQPQTFSAPEDATLDSLFATIRRALAQTKAQVSSAARSFVSPVGSSASVPGRINADLAEVTAHLQTLKPLMSIADIAGGMTHLPLNITQGPSNHFLQYMASIEQEFQQLQNQASQNIK